MLPKAPKCISFYTFIIFTFLFCKWSQMFSIIIFIVMQENKAFVVFHHVVDVDFCLDCYVKIIFWRLFNFEANGHQYTRKLCLLFREMKLIWNELLINVFSGHPIINENFKILWWLSSSNLKQIDHQKLQQQLQSP